MNFLRKALEPLEGSEQGRKIVNVMHYGDEVGNREHGLEASEPPREES